MSRLVSLALRRFNLGLGPWGVSPPRLQLPLQSLHRLLTGFKAPAGSPSLKTAGATTTLPLFSSLEGGLLSIAEKAQAVPKHSTCCCPAP